MVVNTGQEALAWSAATTGQAGSDTTLAPSGPARATLAVSRATLAVSRTALAVMPVTGRPPLRAPIVAAG